MPEPVTATAATWTSNNQLRRAKRKTPAGKPAGVFVCPLLAIVLQGLTSVTAGIETDTVASAV